MKVLSHFIALLSHININNSCIVTKYSELVVIIDFSCCEFTKNSTEGKDAWDRQLKYGSLLDL
jgi:hypothetical protein